jgi:cyanuric acid amidohydrolase
MRLSAYTFDTRGPADVSGLRALLDEGRERPDDLLAVIGKTEGNGGRNDFTRELAMQALEHLMAPRLGLAPERVQDRVIFSFSGGTEGVVTPHQIAFFRSGSPDRTRRPRKRLGVAIASTRAFRPEEIGRMAQVEETARAIREAVDELGVDALADVHLVQMKGAIPSYTPEESARAERAGCPLRCDMVWSRAASALATGLALGEIPRERLSDDVIGRDWELYSTVASCSAKPGLERTEIVVFAMSPYWDGDLVIEHGVLADILDADGVRAVLRKAGVDASDAAAVRARLVAAFAKSEADPRGTIRGRRHTMLQDDDIGDTRYSRCVLAAVLASVLGDTRVYVSTRAEHHGPLGGGPLALILRAEAP